MCEPHRESVGRIIHEAADFQNKGTKRNDLAAPPHFSVTFEKSVATPDDSLSSFGVNGSTFKSSQLMSQKSSR